MIGMKLHETCDEKGCQRMGPDCVRYCALLGEGPQEDDRLEAESWPPSLIEQQMAARKWK